MNIDNLKTCQLWLDRCQEDYKTTKSLYKSNTNYPLICFLSQQNVERYLKSVLILNDFTIEGSLKTHDCLRLAQKVQEFIPEIKELEIDAQKVSKYYTANRYPSLGLGLLTKEEANISLEIVEKFQKIIISYFEKIK